jgi:tetratricopeptide (TPR) repeat protein
LPIWMDAMEPIDRMRRRVDLARQDSDTSLFHVLMYCGEMVTKLLVSGLVAAVQDEKERHRYRLEYGLVRANGLGDWVAVLDETLTGPASQHLRPEARPFQRELTERVASAKGWQFDAVGLVREACLLREDNYEQMPTRPSLRLWFADFSWLRNHTRGHGAPTAEACSRLCVPLEQSLGLLTDKLSLLEASWAFLRRNLSGKYRVIPINGSCEELQYLKSDPRPTLLDGVHIALGAPCRVALMETDLDLSDFYFPNGGFRGDNYELLSYITDQRAAGDATAYRQPPTRLPESETKSLGSLEVQGKAFGNLPPGIPDYVSRSALETELSDVLMNDRHPVVSLVGRGGIGKTSLALEVLHRVANKERFIAVLWFSARDIDLLAEGPKLVRPDVLTDRDLADQLVNLLDPSEQDNAAFEPVEYLLQTLTHSQVGPILFVFDNFETVRNPSDLYTWLDTYIRLPNKILITTRLREFKADYPVEVRGMLESEFSQLVETTATRLGITNLLSPGYVQQLYQESDGHPYVAKVMLGEVASAGSPLRVRRVMASREDILDALFERTYAQLAPVGQRVFLTLCNWRSSVPRLALEAALLRPQNDWMDVQEGIEALRRMSLIDSRISEQDGQEFLSVPLAAALFGKRKLSVSPIRSAIESDTELIRLVGAASSSEVQAGIAPRVGRLFRAVAQAVEVSHGVDDYLPVLEYVARGYPPAWLLLSDLLLEQSDSGWLARAEDCLRSYLEQIPTDWEVWLRLARLCDERGAYGAEVNAHVQACRQPEVPFHVLSNAANRVNSLMADGRLARELDQAERKIVVRDLLTELERRIREADGTGYSRIAWLHMSLGNTSRAKDYTREGLAIEPDNVHLINLGERLSLDQ